MNVPQRCVSKGALSTAGSINETFYSSLLDLLSNSASKIQWFESILECFNNQGNHTRENEDQEDEPVKIIFAVIKAHLKGIFLF